MNLDKMRSGWVMNWNTLFPSHSSCGNDDGKRVINTTTALQLQQHNTIMKRMLALAPCLTAIVNLVGGTAAVSLLS